MKNKFKGKRLLTVRETARWLNISERTLYNRIGRKVKNKFPVTAIRIGKSVRFDLEDLNAYIEKQKDKED